MVGKNKPKKLSRADFKKSFKFVPRIAVDLLLTNNKGEFLLSQRAELPQAGYWHIPGGFLLKGEGLKDCALRIAKEELYLDLKNFKFNFLGLFENLNSDQRGHIVDLVYGCEILESTKPRAGKDTKKVKFFSKIPEKIGFNHRQDLEILGFS